MISSIYSKFLESQADCILKPAFMISLLLQEINFVPDMNVLNGDLDIVDNLGSYLVHEPFIFFVLIFLSASLHR